MPQFIIALILAFGLALEAFAASAKAPRADVLFIFGDVYVEGNNLGAAWRKILDQEGVGYSVKQWKAFAPADLARTKAVAIVDVIGRSGLGGKLNLGDQAQLDNLREWVKAGGGLFFCQHQGQALRPLYGTLAVGDRFGANILFETVSDEGTAKVWGSRKLPFFKATVKGPPEIVGNAKLAWYPHTLLKVEAGVLPAEFTADWTVILEGSPSSKSDVSTYSGIDSFDQRKRSQGFPGRVPLGGVREFGKGRVAYLGLNSLYLAFKVAQVEGDTKTVLTDGIGEEKSDVQRLLLSLFKWLGQAPANVAGPPSFQEVPLLEEKDYSVERRIYEGVMGPRTTHSSGQSTPDEYVQEAKKAGLDFIMFLEEFAALKPGGYDQLVADCERLTDEKFAVFPGITLVDELGDHILAAGPGLELPSAVYLNDKRELLIRPARLKGTVGGGISLLAWFYSTCGFNFLGAFYDFKDGGVPYHDARDVTGMGVVLTERGRVLERNLEAYADEQWNGQRRYPLAVALMREAKELRDGKYYRNAVEAHGIRQLLKLTSFKAWTTANHVCTDDVWPDSGRTFLTNGPKVTMKRTFSDIEGWMPINGREPSQEQTGRFHPLFGRWAATVEARSDQNLREVELYDGVRRIRRFKIDPPAPEFKRTVTMTQEHQRYVWARVVDAKGREAVTRDIATKTHIMQEVQCDDRNNQLFYSYQKRADGSGCKLMYGGPTAIPDKGPWNGRFLPAGYWTFDDKLGIEKYGTHDGSPERSPSAMLAPALILQGMGLPVRNHHPDGWWHDLVKGIEGPAHEHPRRILASGDVLCADRVMDGVFAAGEAAVHVGHTFAAITPSRYLKTTARTTIYNILPDGVAAILWDQDFEILRDLEVDPASDYYIHLGRLGGYAKNWAAKVKGKAAVTGVPGPAVKAVYPFDAGNWVGCYGGTLGSVFCYGLSEGVVACNPDGNFGFGIAAPSAKIPKGTKVRAKLLFVGMNRLTQDPVALAQTVAKEYGLGEEPAYTVKLEAGQVLSRTYELKLKADGHAAVGVIGQTKGLPGNLGVQVQGCNSGWTAFLENRSGGKVRVRPVPSAEGVAYAALPPSDQPYDLFLGNPVRCSDAGIIMDVAKDAENRWQLDAHNPTDQDKQVEISTHPAFRSFKFAGQVEIKAGDSAILQP